MREKRVYGKCRYEKILKRIYIQYYTITFWRLLK